jgi:aspartate/tyrosine/aromatic aminotransferase
LIADVAIVLRLRS